MIELQANQRPKRRGQLQIIVAIKAVAITSILVLGLAWIGVNQRSPTAADLDRKLAQLRADGALLTAPEIAKRLPDPPKERDAGLLFQPAFSLLPPPPNATNLPLVNGTMPRRDEPMPAPAVAALRDHLAGSDALLVVMPDDLTGVRFAMGWKNGFTNLLAYPAMQIRSLAQTLALKAIYEAERDNGRHAARVLRAGFQFVAAQNGDSLVSVMLRVGCAAMMCEAAERVINRVELTEAELRDICAAVKPELIDNFDSAFAVERHIAVWGLNAMRQADPARAGAARFVQVAHANDETLYRDRDYLSFVEAIEKQRAADSLPPLERLRTYEQVEALYTANAKSAATELFARPWSKALRTALETRARLTALETACAIERHRLKRGRLPQSLRDLTGDSPVAADLFTGKALSFKRLTRGYAVYSVGADGIDDAGSERTEANSASGYDVTFIVER